MAGTITLAEYLFTRLLQLGVGSVHGVPGDYNLTLLDYVEPTGLHWVGSANELNAAYAADGYARIKGIGAVITTFGVGELSAINAIAGAYAERAAVVHIVGSPERAAHQERRLIHHTFNDGEYGRFASMAAQVTVAQAKLWDPLTSPEQIDEVLRQCLLHSRPVYIEIPVDCVDISVSAERLSQEVRLPARVPTTTQDKAIEAILQKIYAANRPIILVDGETRAYGIVADVQQLVKRTGWPTWTSAFAKGLVDETLPNVHGIYSGIFADPKAKELFSSSDLILCFGPHHSNTNTYFYSSIPKVDATISFTANELRIGTSEAVGDFPARHVLPELLSRLDTSRAQPYSTYPDLPKAQLPTFASVKSADLVKQDTAWPLLGKFVQPGDILLGETGTAAYGIRDFPLPPHTRMFLPVTWLSIGYMLPAAQGAALAQRELVAAGNYHGLKSARTVLFIGDGSFQMTVQEMGTIIREELDVTIFLINNDGYTIERCIHGLKQGYNDVAAWKYLEAPRFFGASSETYTARIKTYGDLQKVVEDERWKEAKGLSMVEILMEREDAPPGPLTLLIDKQKKEAQI